MVPSPPRSRRPCSPCLGFPNLHPKQVKMSMWHGLPPWRSYALVTNGGLPPTLMEHKIHLGLLMFTGQWRRCYMVLATIKKSLLQSPSSNLGFFHVWTSACRRRPCPKAIDWFILAR